MVLNIRRPAPFKLRTYTISLFFSYRCLYDCANSNGLLDDFAGNYDHLRVVLKSVELRHLGIGVGGNIAQHIPVDMSDHRLWDFGSSRVLNINILDAAFFKKVTGVNPPLSAVDTDIYKFYYKSEELEGLDAPIRARKDYSDGGSHSDIGADSQELEDEEEIEFYWGERTKGRSIYQAVIMEDVDSTFPRYPSTE